MNFDEVNSITVRDWANWYAGMGLKPLPKLPGASMP